MDACHRGFEVPRGVDCGVERPGDSEQPRPETDHPDRTAQKPRDLALGMTHRPAERDHAPLGFADGPADLAER